MTTASIDSSSPSYLSTAFFSQYNLILLGGAALFSLASASPVPLLFGIAVEACWLGFGSKLPAFRRKVDLQADAERRARLDDEVMTGMRSLDAQHTSRLLALGQTVSMLTMHAGDARALSPDVARALAELEQLRPEFLKYCKLHERLSVQLLELSQRPPEAEVARLSQAYAAEKDLGLRLTLHQSIKLAQRKIEQKARMVDMRRSIDLKLQLLEQSLTHLAGQQQMGAAGIDLARDVTSLMAQVGSTAAFEAELSEAAGMPVSVAPSA